jgi:hypothetical protein
MTQVACVLLTIWTRHLVPKLDLGELVSTVDTYLQLGVPVESNYEKGSAGPVQYSLPDNWGLEYFLACHLVPEKSEMKMSSVGHIVRLNLVEV